ncbi:glycosyltransferase family 4 protein [Hoylesella oralis]|nr:hypothetical protein HMPREF1475_01453 [Hoylesella oralis HGA0225]SHF41722.1 Glycosyltransferase involved in cell wall bisynthesis [Hoylesella oralis]
MLMTKTFSPLSVGYDAKRIVRNGTGLGNYGRTLVNDMAHIVPEGTRLRLYTPDLGRQELRSKIIESPSVQFVCPNGYGFPMGKSLWRSRFVVKDLLRDGIDLYHGLSGELPIGIKKAGIKTVVTIHDLIFMRHPEFYNPLDAWIYARKFYRTCHEADRIIAISECTKRDIIEYGKVDPERIDVVYQSCAPRFSMQISNEELQQTSRKYRLPRRYILNVGTIERRKNALLAVKALPFLPADVSLVIVGKRTKYADEITEYLRKKPALQQRVLMLQGVSDADLAAIYRQAACFVYPSRYEGFGLPIIEAIHCGLPVAACTGSCLEEAGGEGCLYVSPDDAEGLAQAIDLLLTEGASKADRQAACRAYIRRFEGNDVASRVFGIYEKLTK